MNFDVIDNLETTICFSEVLISSQFIYEEEEFVFSITDIADDKKYLLKLDNNILEKIKKKIDNKRTIQQKIKKEIDNKITIQQKIDDLFFGIFKMKIEYSLIQEIDEESQIIDVRRLISEYEFV
jgi:hypothetical protein